MGKLLQNNDRTNWFDDNKKKILRFAKKFFSWKFQLDSSKIRFCYLIVNDSWLILAGVILTDFVDDFDFQN
jgi:hypothetical protein